VSFIRANKVGKVYRNGNQEGVVALEGFNLDVREKEFVSVVGPSGCGKSTFLFMLAGLEEITTGDILLEGKPVQGPDPKQAMVFQEYLLFPWRTVRQNIAFGPEVRGLSEDRTEEIVRKYVNLVGLAGFEHSYPYELSGGMKQKVAIARALANDPRVILMDEPFASLDALSREILQQELLAIWALTEATVIFVTHSISEAVFLSDRVAVLTKRPGRIKETIAIDLPRPRDMRMTATAQFIQYEQRIRELVLDEVQRNETGG